MRYFIKFSYNGTGYHGWQVQPNAVSVQGTLTGAMSVLLHRPIELVGAGRTDAGVHATEMYAHFDIYEPIDAVAFVPKLNSYLPKDIAISAVIPVHDTAHARFDAVCRSYEYHMHSLKDVFLDGLSWYHHRPLDPDIMNEAASYLFKHTDFQSFSKSNTDVHTYNCRIDEAHWKRIGDRLIFTITADRFLRNMVRAIVGTLVNIGSGKAAITDMDDIIKSKDRGKAGFSVPAHGLYLNKINYTYIDDLKASYGLPNVMNQ